MGWFDWLTGRSDRTPGAEAAALYARVVAAARQPGWYRDGGIADDLDGRFAVLASVLALVLLRLEQGDDSDQRRSVALTEAFIADMDVQMREAGFGDPSLGKQVRQLVGALAARVDRLRSGGGDPAALHWSLFRDAAPAAGSDHAVAQLAALRDALARYDGTTMVEGAW